MTKYIFLGLSTALIFSCNFSGIKENTEDYQLPKEDVETIHTVSDSVSFDNGMIIRYFKHGTGDSLRKDDVVNIDYSCRLKDGTVFDSNDKIGHPIPFLVGWMMQTKGWDLAFNTLRVGDEVEIFLPAALARGDKSVQGTVPPNSDNWIRVSIVEKLEPQFELDGVKVFLVERENKSRKLKLGDEVQIEFIAYSESKPRYSSSFENGSPFALKIGSASNLPGLNMAMEFAHFGDMIWVFIPSKHAFGAKGSVDNVKPNEDIFFDILIAEE